MSPVMARLVMSASSSQPWEVSGSCSLNLHEHAGLWKKAERALGCHSSMMPVASVYLSASFSSILPAGLFSLRPAKTHGMSQLHLVHTWELATTCAPRSLMTLTRQCSVLHVSAGASDSGRPQVWMEALTQGRSPLCAQCLWHSGAQSPGGTLLDAARAAQHCSDRHRPRHPTAPPCA